MFTVVVERRTRSVWSARTVAISAGAHLLVLGAVVTAVANTRETPTKVVTYDLGPYPEKQPPPETSPTPRTPADQPVPVRTLELRAPAEVPDHVDPPKATDTPLLASEVTGEGPLGAFFGTPPAPPQPPAPPAEPPLRDWRIDDPIDARDAEQLPELLSARDAQRMLERVYPSRLRDTGVTGHTTVLLVIDKTGAVEPGSVTVQETTHDAFRDAAVRAAEHFRFRPARLHGVPVSVVISIPIDWQIQS